MSAVQAEIENLIKKVEENPAEYNRILEIGNQLTKFGDSAVEILSARLLAMPSELHKLTDAQFALSEAYLWTLESINTSEAYEAILNAKIHFDESTGYWDDLLDILETYSSGRLLQISRAVIRANKIEVKTELAALLATSTDKPCEVLSQELVENTLLILEEEVEFIWMFQKWLNCIINEYHNEIFSKRAENILRKSGLFEE